MIVDGASPMLGQHLFRMESGELRSKPTEEAEVSDEENNMEEDVNDSDPSGLPE